MQDYDICFKAKNQVIKYFLKSYNVKKIYLSYFSKKMNFKFMDIALHKPTVGADYLEFNM